MGAVRPHISGTHGCVGSDLLLEGSERSILDLGVGTGKFLQSFLSVKSFDRAVGLDFSAGMLEEARRHLPASVELVNADFHNLPFEDRGFDELRIITTDALAANTAFQGKKKVTALKLDANAGKLEFFEFDKALGNFRNTGNSFYLEDSSLFGAVFSDDAEMYKCSMENAFRRLNLISTIYIEKTNSLRSFYSAPPNANTNCAARHDSQYISAIKSNSASFSSIDSSKIGGILSASGSLEQQNKEAQLYSCAMIY